MTIAKPPIDAKKDPKPPTSIEPTSGSGSKSGTASRKNTDGRSVDLGNPRATDITCCGDCLTLPPFKLLVAASWVAATSLATYGIQDTVLNIPGQLIANVSTDSFFERFRSRLTVKGQNFLWGIIVGSLALGAILGSAVAIPLADRWGRKLTLLYVANCIVVLGSILMFLAHSLPSFEMLLAGRIVLGFAVGLSTVVLPMYLIELSATVNRGFMGSLQGLGIALFSSIATGVGMPEVLGNERGWGWLLSFQAFFAVAMMLTATMCPESPQYLYVNNNNEAAAKQIADDYCSESFKTLKARYPHFQVGSTLNPHGESRWPAPLVEAVALSVCIGATRSFSGVTVWNTYSTMLLQKQGVSVRWSNYLTLGSASCQIFACFGNAVLIDRLGRRFCFLGGLLIINVVWVVCFFLWLTEPYISSGKDENWTEIFRQVMLELTFSLFNPLCTSNVAWFLASELVPESVRAMITGISMVALWAGYLLTAMLYPILEAQIHGYTILALFVFPSTAVWGYLFVYLPETSKKSFVDIYGEIGRTTWRTIAEEVPYDPEYEYAVRKRLQMESADWPVVTRRDSMDRSSRKSSRSDRSEKLDEKTR